MHWKYLHWQIKEMLTFNAWNEHTGVEKQNFS